MIPPLPFRRSNEYLQRGVARTGAHPGKTHVNACAALLERNEGVRNAEAQIVVRVDAVRSPDPRDDTPKS
ncbi:hypothetical protein CNECB9_2610029 [Cupriavidus necator]|uniref:Uncharacterized protein n=1 Tax=Cupriavidus necator TaxID=106590 RepID=A0A1K0IF49_CUPNE|nr:hypothetical protein CNECB9_2610029 [Cupriavidus necator]